MEVFVVTLYDHELCAEILQGAFATKTLAELYCAVTDARLQSDYGWYQPHRVEQDSFIDEIFEIHYIRIKNKQCNYFRISKMELQTFV